MFLSVSGDKILTIFEELRGTAPPHLVEVITKPLVLVEVITKEFVICNFSGNHQTSLDLDVVIGNHQISCLGREIGKPLLSKSRYQQTTDLNCPSLGIQ